MTLLEKKYILIFLAVILISIPFALFTVSRNTNIQNQSPTPEPSPEKPGFSSIYEEEAGDKLLDKVGNRQKLSSTDAQGMSKILSTLPKDNPSGYVYQSDSINIEYISGPDVFQVEILKTDFQKAKSEALFWFQSKGVSLEGVCNYPVQFYLSFEAASEIQESEPTIQFSPLAEGC